MLSAKIRITDEPAVKKWLDGQAAESIWTAIIAIFEVRFVLALLTWGRHRDQLDSAFTCAIEDILGGQVTPCDLIKPFRFGFRATPEPQAIMHRT